MTAARFGQDALDRRDAYVVDAHSNDRIGRR
jgi:hypothetical protein